MVQGPSGGASRNTLARFVYDSLRSDILRGRLMPGEKLRIDGLRDRLGTGATPIREALNRLAAEGLVTQQDQRGFSIPLVSQDDLDELTRTRCWLNEIVVREAILRGDATWEEAIVLAFHRLSRQPTTLPEDPTAINPEWGRVHRAFHASLIAGCGSRVLETLAMDLFDRADRYRHLSVAVLPPGPPRDVPAEHRAIMEAVLARDAALAVDLLNRHFTLTSRIVAQTEAVPAAALEGQDA